MGDGDFSVQDRRVVVVGAARSGVAAAELLARRGALVTLTETRNAFDGADRLQAAGVRLELGGHQRDTLAGADLVVVSPGVPVEQPVFDGARVRGVEIIGELELASRWIRGRMLAVTGTKGKSTTTTLLGRMLTSAGRRVLVGGISACRSARRSRRRLLRRFTSWKQAASSSRRPRPSGHGLPCG